MYDDSDKTYLIGDYVIEVWEGQHPHAHEHCWKWRITNYKTEEGIASGFREFQEDAHTAALKALTFISLRSVEDRETLNALWPGFEDYVPRAPGIEDNL